MNGVVRCCSSTSGSRIVRYGEVIRRGSQAGQAVVVKLYRWRSAAVKPRRVCHKKPSGCSGEDTPTGHGLNPLQMPTVRASPSIVSNLHVSYNDMLSNFGSPRYDRSCASISPNNIFVSLLPVRTAIEDQLPSTQPARSTH